MDYAEIADVLRLIRTRAEDSRPGQLAVWETTAEALAAIDELIAATERRTGTPDGLAFYFAPTGHLQDLSIENGWGDKFLELAARVDSAVGASEREA